MTSIHKYVHAYLHVVAIEIVNGYYYSEKSYHVRNKTLHGALVYTCYNVYVVIYVTENTKCMVDHYTA